MRIMIHRNMQESFDNNLSVPPLPPKPLFLHSPSSCSSQITNSTSKCIPNEQPIRRLTSQAGVHHPLPASDIPPPLPPLNPGLRTQATINSLMNRGQQTNPLVDTSNSFANSTLNVNPNSNYRNGNISHIEKRLTERPLRNIELEEKPFTEQLGTCAKCFHRILQQQDACKAMDQIYHSHCFVCSECGKTLKGRTFYAVGDKVYCEEDFEVPSLRKCAACSLAIHDTMLNADGFYYHPQCFRCCICGKCLDGVKYTLGVDNKIYCAEDYYRINQPTCAKCGEPRIPIEGSGDSIRIPDMNTFATANHRNIPELYDHNMTLPPLPPKPYLSDASSCSTQFTTLSSKCATNEPIRRLTSQVGVQHPLPDSDIPPPLPPPLNLGSRTLPNMHYLMNRGQQSNPLVDTTNPIPDFASLDLNSRIGTMTDSSRKVVERFARNIELKSEHQQQQQQKPFIEPLGTCAKCFHRILQQQDACKAMDQIYHSHCFVCSECGKTLKGRTFYAVGDKVYCEQDFEMPSLRKCATCSQPIYDTILDALGSSYHPQCFKCCICGKCLDGIKYTLDMDNNIYCVEDYYRIHSPKCARCAKPITPIDGSGETVCVVSLNKDYHIDCYCCEDCGLQLTDEEPNQSYPLNNTLLCQRCHINRLRKP